jgi:hypothetical protein
MTDPSPWNDFARAALYRMALSGGLTFAAGCSTHDARQRSTEADCQRHRAIAARVPDNARAGLFRCTIQPSR